MAELNCKNGRAQLREWLSLIASMAKLKCKYDLT